MPQREVRRKRRWLRRTGITFLVLLALLAASYLLRGPLLSGPLRRLAARELGRVLDAEVKIGALEGDWVTELVVRDVQVRARGRGTLRHLACTRLVVGFGLPALLSGDLPGALHGVLARGLDVRLDLAAPPGAPEEPSAPGPDLEEILRAIPHPMPDVDLQGSLHADTGDGGALSIDRFVLKGGGSRLVLDLEDLAAPPPLPPRPARRFGATLERPAPTRLVWSSQGSLSGVQVEHLELRAGRGKPLQGRARILVAGGGIRATLGAHGLEASARKLEPARIPGWIRALAGGSGALPDGGTLSLDASLAGWRDGDLVARVDLDGRGLTWPDARVDRVALKGSWSRGRGRVGSLEAVVGASHLEARDVELDPEHPWIVTTAAGLDLRVPEVRTLLEELPLLPRDTLEPYLPGPGSGVRLAAVRNQGGEVELRSLRLTTPGGGLTASGSLGIPASPAAWRRTQLALTVELDVSDAADLLPSGLGAPALAGRGRLSADLSGTLESLQGTAHLQAEELAAGGRRMQHLEARARLGWPFLELESLTAAAPGVRLQATGRVELEGPRPAEAAVHVDVQELARLEELLGPLPALQGAASLEVSAGMDLDAGPSSLEARATVTGTGLAVSSHHLGDLRAGLTVGWPRVAIQELQLQGRRLALEAGGHMVLGRFEELSGELHLEARIPRLEVLEELELGTPPLSGSLALSADVLKQAGGTWETLTGRGHLEGRDLLVDRRPVDHMLLRFRSRRRRHEIEDLTLELPEGRMQAAGALDLLHDGWRARLRSFEVDLAGQQGRLQEPLVAQRRAGELEVGDFVVAGPGGSLHGRLHLGQELDFLVEGRELDLTLLPGGLAGLAAFRLEGRGDASRPRLAFTLEAPELAYRGRAARLLVSARQSDEGIFLERLDLQAPGVLEARGGGRLPFLVGTAGIRRLPEEQALFELQAKGGPATAWKGLGLPEGLTFQDLAVTAEGRGPDLDLRIAVDALRWKARGTAVGLEGATSLRVALDEGGLAADLVGGGEEGLQVRGRLRSTAPVSWLHPLEAGDRLARSEVTGELRADLPDLALLAPLAPGLVRLGGKAGVRVGVSGPVQDPDLSGEAVLEDLSVKTEGALPGIVDGHVQLSLKGRRLEVQGLGVRLGYAPLEVSGSASWPRGGEPQLDLAATGRNVLLYRQADLSVRADLDVTVTGPVSGLTVGGSGTVTDAVYSRPIELLARSAPSVDESFQLFSIREPPFSDMRFDLQVKADRSFRIENNMVAARLSTDVHLRGTGEVPRPEGVVHFRNATVLLPFSRLQVQRGEVVFAEGNPFSPRINVAAHTRMQGYDLNVLLSGHLPDVNVEVASLPPLSQQDALVLLTTGATPAQIRSQGLGQATMRRAGALLGESLVSELSGPSSPHEEGFLDRFTIEVGRNTTETGQSTVEAEFGLTDRWFLRAERDRFDNYNLGVVWRIRFK